MLFELAVNGRRREVDVAEGTPLLWVLRDHLHLTGAKYGCGVGLCGVCTVHLDGAPVRSCVLPVEQAEGAEVTTIEGVSEGGLHPVQRAWVEEDVPQCGYCQPGQIMTAIALLRETPDPDADQVSNAMGSVLCRCGTYPRIHAAVQRAAADAEGG